MAVLGLVATEAFPQFFIGKSQTWVPPQDGTICIHAIGAGGGGSAGPESGNTYGGAAGAYFKVPSLAVTTSGSFTLVVGSGGRGGQSASEPNGSNGNNGGSTTVAGTGLTGTKTAGGGTGANWQNGAAGGAFSGSGESAVGYTGGAGSSTGGGGAVGVYATGATSTSSGNSNNNGGQTDAQGGGIGTSSFGTICGGQHSGSALYLYSYAITSGRAAWGDDLCGGGKVGCSQGNISAVGGNGGIGGGGGGGVNYPYSPSGYGGDGGDGIILIQYLPW